MMWDLMRGEYDFIPSKEDMESKEYIDLDKRFNDLMQDIEDYVENHENFK